jgi:hypothetical protein
MTTASTELTEEAQNAVLLGRYTQTVAEVRKAVLESMTPLEIAQMIGTHFDEAPEDALDTAQAIVREHVKNYAYTRAQAHEWADKAFSV